MDIKSKSVDFWSTVPYIDDALDADDSARAEKSDVRAQVLPPSRRTLLKSMGVLGGALALSVFGAIRPSGRAAAAVGTEHFNCAGYDSWTGYNNNAAPCVGFPYGSQWCGTDGWFLIRSDSFMSCGPVSICGNGVTQKNAWRWTHSGTPYRCADGHVRFNGGGSGYYICSKSWP